MGQGETQSADDTRSRLIETARAMVLRGDNKFSIATLCQETGVERSEFRAHFSGKTALMAALMHEQASQAVSVAELPAVQPMPEPQAELQIPKAELEPPVSTPDAWLERRLRVFERALTSLEAKAEATAREQARVIAQLEERLAALSGETGERRLAPRPVVPQPVEAASRPAPTSFVIETAETAPEVQEAEEDDSEPVEKPVAEALTIPPLPITTISKEEMADVLQSARARAQAAAAAMLHEEKPKEGNRRVRWLAVGALALVVLFLCIGLTLGNTASATQNDRLAEWQGAGTSHRHVVQGALAQTIASADFGDAKAEARLALAFLRGQGVARDAGAARRWSQAAAEAGDPVGEYLLGAIYSQGEAVKADPVRAFALFQAAAAKGNLKAMHNLAIAYAEGQGTVKDEATAAQWFTRAAEHGYVDSAFDLAVMYERGTGVVQDPRQALKWYGIAAQAGDQPSRTRADFLRGQMTVVDAKLATDAVMAFAPLPPLTSANAL
jgi:TPR repeat protein/AcrR family transcriptional regulator